MANMIFIVVVSVLGYAFASPVCTDEESMKCVPSEGATEFLKIELPWTADEDMLDKECPIRRSMLECGVAFAKRCSDTPQGSFLEGFESFKDLNDKLCDKSCELRAEYFEHVSCLNDQIQRRNPVCMEFLRPPPGTVSCSSQMNHYTNCVERAVRKSCGVKATEVFRTIYAPRLSLNIAGCERLKH